MTTALDSPAAPTLASVSEALADAVDAVGAAVAAVRGPGRHAVASGIVWRPGVLVTAAHVFRRSPAAVSVTGAAGTSVEAALIGIDPTTDIAAFRLPDAAWPVARLADDDALRTGHLAFAVGRSQRGELSSSFGMVNRTGGAWQTWLGGRIDRLIRLDGGLHDGLSGGAVADASGRVVGMATSALARGYGVAVPVATVSRVLDALLADGRVGRAFLGISAQAVQTGQPEAAQGLLVTALAPDGPAAQAGALVGDIVLAVDGHPASSLADLRHQLAGRIGQSVALKLSRGGAPAELPITVGSWPNDARRC